MALAIPAIKHTSYPQALRSLAIRVSSLDSHSCLFTPSPLGYFCALANHPILLASHRLVNTNHIPLSGTRLVTTTSRSLALPCAAPDFATRRQAPPPRPLAHPAGAQHQEVSPALPVDDDNDDPQYNTRAVQALNQRSGPSGKKLAGGAASPAGRSHVCAL